MAEGEDGQSTSGESLTRAKRINRDPGLIGIVKRVREALPGDSSVEQNLSSDPEERWARVGGNLERLTAERPGLLGELGLSALQVLRAIADSDVGEETSEMTILFTDLVDFSSWALEAGDSAALELLGDVNNAIELAVLRNDGEVVKWIGDGMMAVFASPQGGLDAVVDARRRLAKVTPPGYTPRIRAGMHSGRPRKLDDDYLGVDVNIAARVAEAASGDELLISGPAADALSPGSVSLRKKRFFRGKGVPKELSVYSVRFDR